MTEIPELRRPSTQESTNWKLCLLCQTSDAKKGALVLQPRIDTYKHLLDSIIERSSLLDGDYVLIQQRLKDCTCEILCRENAVWHRSCYSDATSKVKLQRARDRNLHAVSTGSYTVKKRGQKRNSTELEEPSTSDSPTPFTRSLTVPLDKDLCFFCQKNDGQALYTVRTENAGNALRDAIHTSQDEVLKVRLSTSIAPCDAHAIDVRYHKPCWTQNVFHVLRDKTSKANTQNNVSIQTVSLIELINVIDVQTQNKAYLSMDDIETTYVNMLGGEEVLQDHSPTFSRQWLKDKILCELPSVTTVLQKNRRKSAILYSPKACEEDLVHSAVTTDDDAINNMKSIYKSAQILRKSITDFTRDREVGFIPVSSSDHDVPADLYALIRWIMVGPVDELETETRTTAVDRAVLTVSQNIMYGFKTQRQVKYKPSTDSSTFRVRHDRENPQALGLALTAYHDTQSKKLIRLLNAQGHCVPYSHVMRLETALANAVVENTKQFKGLYVPPFLKKGTFVFFAADNTDFAEDTPDGRGTTHGTITAVYQKASAPGEPISTPLHIVDTNNLSVDPYHVPIMQCSKPKPHTVKRAEEFTINKAGVSDTYQLTQIGWVVASTISRTKEGCDSCMIPGWAGYNSLISTSQSVTRVGALPLLPKVAHEWSTLLTVINQTNQLKSLAVGDAHPTVITFDMALYKKVVQLLDARPDLKRTVVPRLGELHVIMAALRALGASIENSGIDDAWIEADVYGSATTRQISKCTHYKRTLRAHIYSYMALYEIALEEFFKDNPHLKEVCVEATDKIEDACSQTSRSANANSVKQANATLQHALTSAGVVTTFREWEEHRSKDSMFKAMMNYIHRVETILFFVMASRNADLTLHLEAGEALSKLFFAMDRIKYKRLWPRYISDMYDLKTNHPETWREMEEGNISVTKNDIPFVSIGPDYACEHINKQMKVHSGLTGISNNPNARQRFFLATPELSHLSTEFKNQFQLDPIQITEHHDLAPSVVKREHIAINTIKAVILTHGNPFTIEGDKLHNIITHAYVPDEYVAQILNIDDTGQQLYEDYVAERINGDVSLWAPVKKQNNKMFMSGDKKMTVKVRDKNVDLKETKDLYGRLMVLSRSSRDIDQKHAISNFEFTLTPRALFAPNGTILPCTDKSKLIYHLEKLGTSEVAHQEDREHMTEQVEPDVSVISQSLRKIAIVDGMFVVQAIKNYP